MGETIKPSEEELGEITGNPESITDATEATERPKPPMHVWMIEDNKSTVDSFKRAAGALFGPRGINANLQTFQEGETAVQEFRDLAEANQPLPAMIFMDYQLDRGVEKPKYTDGVEVIAALQSVAEENGVSLPEIIAFSSEDEYQRLLRGAGAITEAPKTIKGMVESVNNLLERI